MAVFILTYDVDKRHVDVKAGLIKKGFADKIFLNKKWFYLPNTTLYLSKDKYGAIDACNDFDAVIKELNDKSVASNKIKTERLFAVEYEASKWAGRPGEEHKS